MQGCSYEWKGNGIRLDLNRSLAGGGWASISYRRVDCILYFRAVNFK